MLQAKKSLGQNFLEDTSFIDGILESAAIDKNEVVVEIGPGLGALTFPLTEQAGEVIAVETDPRFKETLLGGNRKNLTLIEGNILDLDLDTLLIDKNIETNGNTGPDSFMDDKNTRRTRNKYFKRANNTSSDCTKIKVTAAATHWRTEW